MSTVVLWSDTRTHPDRYPPARRACAPSLSGRRRRGASGGAVLCGYTRSPPANVAAATWFALVRPRGGWAPGDLVPTGDRMRADYTPGATAAATCRRAFGAMRRCYESDGAWSGRGTGVLRKASLGAVPSTQKPHLRQELWQDDQRAPGVREA
jgi:hypothetical protein